MTITSPNNDKLKTAPQAPPAPARARPAGPVRRRGRGSARRRRRRRLDAGGALRGERQRPARDRGRRSGAEVGHRSRVGHAHLGDLQRALGGGAARPALRLPARRRRSRQRRDRAALGCRLRCKLRCARRRSADPFSPKAVRASMGAIFAVPVAHATPADLPGITIALVADADDALPAVAADLAPQAEISVLVGAEREGLPDEVLAACDHMPASRSRPSRSTPRSRQASPCTN